MRTTITLDADTAALIERTMAERGWTFKMTVNTAIRQGLTRGSDASDDGGCGERFRTPTFAMGNPADVDLDRALQLADGLEDAEILRELERGR